jgi:hypothetical protein
LPRLIIPPKFRRVLASKPPEMRAAVMECVHRLGDNPRHPSLRTHRVRGVPGVFEAYVDLANRVTFEWDDDAIRLRNNCNHSILDRRP